VEINVEESAGVALGEINEAMLDLPIETLVGE